jgi:triacylglycerol lipase
VDGIWGNGTGFKSLCARLAAQGYSCLVPALQPNNAVHGIADLAVKLQRYIEARVPADTPITMIGFSMGSIVARYYLQELEGHRRAKALFAVCGPHRGTWTAYAYHGQGARDLRPGSSLLRRLDASRSRLAHLALHAYGTPFDLMILPATSTHWPDATNLRVWTPLHRFMQTNRRVHEDIVRRLENLAAGRGSLHDRSRSCAP